MLLGSCLPPMLNGLSDSSKLLENLQVKSLAASSVLVVGFYRLSTARLKLRS